MAHFYPLKNINLAHFSDALSKSAIEGVLCKTSLTSHFLERAVLVLFSSRNTLYLACCSFTAWQRVISCCSGRRLRTSSIDWCWFSC